MGIVLSSGASLLLVISVLQHNNPRKNFREISSETEESHSFFQIIVWNKRVAAEDLRAGFFIKKKSKFKMKIQSRVGTRGWNDAQSKGFITEG